METKKKHLTWATVMTMAVALFSLTALTACGDDDDDDNNGGGGGRAAATYRISTNTMNFGGEGGTQQMTVFYTGYAYSSMAVDDADKDWLDINTNGTTDDGTTTVTVTAKTNTTTEQRTGRVYFFASDTPYDTSWENLRATLTVTQEAGQAMLEMPNPQRIFVGVNGWNIRTQDGSNSPNRAEGDNRFEFGQHNPENANIKVTRNPDGGYAVSMTYNESWYQEVEGHFTQEQMIQYEVNAEGIVTLLTVMEDWTWGGIKTHMVLTAKNLKPDPNRPFWFIGTDENGCEMTECYYYDRGDQWGEKDLTVTYRMDNTKPFNIQLECWQK